MTLPDAEKYDVRIFPEIHNPTVLKSQIADDYLDFTEKQKKNFFGINVDLLTHYG